MSMPSKLLLNLHAMSNRSEVLIQQDDGPPVKLEWVKRIVITADAEDPPRTPPMAELVMYAPDTAFEVVISDKTAEAIAYHERRKLLGFLTTTDIAALRSLREELRNDWEGIEQQTELAALDKLLAELERQQQELEVF